MRSGMVFWVLFPGSGQRESADFLVACWKGRVVGGDVPIILCKKSCLQAELVQAPAVLDRHLQRMTEKLRSGVHGKVREATQQPIVRIVVAVDRRLLIRVKAGGLLELDGYLD